MNCNSHYETQINDFVRASINIDKLSDSMLKQNLSQLLLQEIERYSNSKNRQYLFCDNDTKKGSAAFNIFTNLVISISDKAEVSLSKAQKAAAAFMYSAWQFEVPLDWYHID